MRCSGDGRPWVSWGALAIVAYGLKRHYSRASVEDLAWILEPTARAVGWLRGETLAQGPAGWMPPDGSYVIAPACAGVNFLILALTVSVLGFSHRLRSPRQRLGWWLGSLPGAWALTIAVNTARILAAVELYRLGLAEQAHRFLGIVVYLGALWVLYGALDRLTGARSRPLEAVLVPAAYLGMTLGVPLLTGAFRRPGGLYVEHAMMIVLVTLVSTAAMASLRRQEKP
ncbi:MAG: exosortase K [Acidobacteriota bacterium]